MNVAQKTDIELISTSEFADIVGMARGTIRRYLVKGKLPYENLVRYPDENRLRYQLDKQLAEDIRDIKDWKLAIAMYKERHGIHE